MNHKVIKSVALASTALVALNSTAIAQTSSVVACGASKVTPENLAVNPANMFAPTPASVATPAKEVVYASCPGGASLQADGTCFLSGAGAETYIPIINADEFNPAKTEQKILSFAPDSLAKATNPASAEETDCDTRTHGKRNIRRDVTLSNQGVNTEGDVVRDINSVSGFKISVDGDTLAGDGFDYEAGQRATDVALEKASIQIKNDGLDSEPYLNVVAQDNAVTALRGQAITFHPFWNYGAFIEKAEVRLVAANDSIRSEDAFVIPVKDGVATLNVGSNLPDEMIYVLRVYDEDGRFDQTIAKSLSILDIPLAEAKLSDGDETLAGYGLDRTAHRNIKIKGSSVTVYGKDVPSNASVKVMGTNVPVDRDGKFIREMILPYGSHSVDVGIDDGVQTAEFVRDLHINSTDFFYVALGDVTLGTQNSNGPADLLASSDEDFNDVYVNGRGAMYMKGRFKGDYKVTASVDTGEDRIQDLLKNLDDKDPRQLLRRLDGDRFYPVYGDDSTTLEDAPTQGRFYLRVEKDDSHVMWGNFATQVTGTEFAHLDRGLYGAIADYNSTATTNSGDRVTQITAFAADPGTLPSREEFRGTGGSVYFLERQDLSIGSERVRIEVRDKISGLVVDTRDLRPQEDYDVDYIQGRVLLSDPLQSTVSDNQIVRNSSLPGNEVYLVVRYEYTPSLSDVGGYTVGGRATHWVGDNLRFGATAQKEETGAADQNLIGADVLVQHSAGTYLKAELAQTEGLAFGKSNSTDGGFNFDAVVSAGQQNVKAEAYRVEGAVDLSDISGQEGRVNAYYDHQDAGFSGSGRVTDGEVDRWGAHVDASIAKNTDVSVKYDEVDSSVRGKTRAVYGDVSQQVNENMTLSLGVRHDDRNIAAFGALPAVDGSRTDVSTQVDYAMSSAVSVYAFGQATVDRDQTRQKNNRAGVGGLFKINDRLTVGGEVSEGDGGLGANAQATFKRTDNSEFYLGYALSTDRTDTGHLTQSQTLNDFGTLTFGGRTRFNDSLSVYGEERLGFGRHQSSMTHAYGVTFNPSEIWSLGASVENGRIEDDIDGVFERTAFALSAARSSETFRLASNLEARFEDGVTAGSNRDRTTWLMRNTAAVDANKDWEILGRFNFAISDSDQSDFLNADFIEGVLGAAYRPIKNDRLNALLKYTYFEDLAPAAQISAGGTTAIPRQKSQILSVDAIYDLTPKLSIGGKYGFRSGEVSFDRVTNDYLKSDAHIGVLRMDYHVIGEWDVLAEGRVLRSELAGDERLGALVGVYRHIQDHVKVGAGYNFSKFSDDLTNFDNDNDGFFVNLLGKF